MREIIHGNCSTQNPDESLVERVVSKKLFELAHPSYANILASRIIEKDNGRMPSIVSGFADHMRQLEDSLSHN